MLWPPVRKGFALITVTIVVAVLLGLSGYFVNLSITDMRIARAYAATTRAYYLAETATAIFVAQLKKNEYLATAFINGALTNSNSTLAYNDIFEKGDNFEVYAQSSAAGDATVFARAGSPLDNVSATRKIATDISRALGGSITDYAIFTGGSNENLSLKIDATFDGGILFSNADIKIENNTQITVQNGQVWAHGALNVYSGSTLNIINGGRLENVPMLDMPAVDFDSADPTSWRSQATQIMTPPQFNALPNNSTLSGIIFVNGTPADLKKNLTVNGLLVINGSFEIEKPGTLTINAPVEGPAGLLVHNTLEIESNATINGLVYASNELEIEYDDDDTEGTLIIYINGGLIGRNVKFKRDKPGPTNIIISHNPELIGKILQDEFNTTAPTIDVGHWEEQY